MLPMRAAVIHSAGVPDGLVQRCSLCGTTLIDRRSEMTMVGDQGPVWWAGCVEVEEGRQVATELKPNCVDRTLVQFE